MQRSEIAVALLDRISNGRLSSLRELLTPGAIMELPFAPGGVSGRFDGVEEVLAALQYLDREFRHFHFQVHECYEAADAVVLEATSIGVGLTRGVYQNRYVFVFQFEQGRISRWREYFNPQRI